MSEELDVFDKLSEAEMPPGFSLPFTGGYEITILARLLASLKKPVGIYFVSEDIYTLASYYRHDELCLHLRHPPSFLVWRFALHFDIGVKR